jgi:hypothetical protein
MLISRQRSRGRSLLFEARGGQVSWQEGVPLYQSPLFNAHADQWICFQTLTGGLEALFYDSSDQVVWAYFKPADNDTPEEITRQLAELQKFGPGGFMIWVPQDRSFEVYFGDAGTQVRQVELQAQAEHDVIAFVDASYAGPVNIDPDYIEHEWLQLVYMRFWEIVDSGATKHIAPYYIVNAVTGRINVAPIRRVRVINLVDFLLDDEEDDDEDGWAEPPELPPGGPAAWYAQEVPLPPNVPVLDLDAFLLGVDVPAELLPDGPALNLDPTLGLDATADLAGPLTMLSGDQERCFSELRSLTGHALNGQVYMVYRDLRLQRPLVTLVPKTSTTSLVSTSAALSGSFAICSFRRRLFGSWLTLGQRSTSYGIPSSPPTFELGRMRFEVFKEWLRLLSARLFLTFLCLRMFRMRGGLLNISLQVTTIRGSCPMRGSRSSRSRL